ncbi:hypothetical protein NMG60_11030835 [Bertholletia excelsa]
MESVRLRVKFEDRQILNKSQRSEGLKRSWLLLKPPHETISDLSAYLTHIFDLYQSCPNGIILSMGGFVLPQFESTSILKDKDVIRVKKKGGLLKIDSEGDGAELENKEKIEEKQPLLVALPLLANQEFGKESGYLSETEDGRDDQSEGVLHVDNSPDRSKVSKKRKATNKLQDSDSKKRKKCTIDTHGTENDINVEQKESHGLHLGNRIKKKKRVADSKGKPNTESIPGSAESDIDHLEHSPSQRVKLEENGMGCDNRPQTPEGTKKVPSRSARRKKAKRQWLKEIKKAEKEKVEKKELNQMQIPEEGTHKNSTDHQQENQKSEADKDIVVDENIVPIVIRPGHIRFEPLEKERKNGNIINSKMNKVQFWQDIMQMGRQYHQKFVLKETFQWKGITSKKKGQKWCKQNSSSCRNDDDDPSKEHYRKMNIKKVNHANDPIDFEKLAPFTSWPREGDVIAYRLVELLSNWTPELSTFRVGKISRFDPKSNTILLIQLPEYPIPFEKSDEGDRVQSADSLYGENGSLEIHFKSLIDVRIVKHGNSAPAKAITSGVGQGHMLNKFATSAMVPDSNHNQTHTSILEADAWNEINQALSAQKALIQDNCGSKTCSRSPWPGRVPRRNGIGQTSIPRARKNI